MNKKPVERRKHTRLPIIKDLAEPIEIVVSGKQPTSLPGILTNLSAGGLDLVLMGSLSETHQPKNLELSLSHIHGLHDLKVSGRIVWTREKGGTTLVGIEFTQIGAKHQKHINDMAKAYWECESRIEQGEFEICFRECAYWGLCSKPVKLQS
jgi:c-di-GMP-binding flagellar brake protein YcgR